MKKKKEIVFNPADYDYLDDPEMPLEGWVWEFERRSTAYRNAYTELIAKGKTSVTGLIFFEACEFDPSKKWREVDHVTAYLSKANPVKVVNLKWGHVIPSDDSEPFIFKDAQFKAEAGKVTVTYSSRNSHPFDTVRHQMGKETIVMALINLAANNKKIMPLVEDSLDKWRKALKILPKRTSKKSKGISIWKSYLMTYDIVKKHNRVSYKTVGEKLYECFHEKSYKSDRNIQNYFEGAKALVEGEYKSIL